MKTRLIAALLSVVVAVFGVVSVQSIAAPQPAAAAAVEGPISGPISGGVTLVCDTTVVGWVGAITGENWCKKAGNAVGSKVSSAFSGVWQSVIGELLTSAEDLVKWVIKMVFTLALTGPSLKLQDTGLFGRNATLAGMLVWLGWVIAAFGLVWQLGKMAVTGQTKYAGQALVGWVQNALITGGGLTIIACLLSLGDAMTTGLVNKTFGSGGDAYQHIAQVMMPATVKNPVMVLCMVTVLILVGGLQLTMIFLRQAAIPLQALLLPIAGAGRVGGEATRQWAPRLITAILTAIAYKPLLAVIICAGFSEFGSGKEVTDWLRGLAVLLLGVLAPGPLMKVFAPIGAEIGTGLAASGALGAAASLGGMVGGKDSGGGPGGGQDPATPVDQAKHLDQTMPKSYGKDGGDGGGKSGRDGQAGQDAVAQAARTQAAQAPGGAPPSGGAPVPAVAGGETGATATGTATAAGSAGAGAGAGVAGPAGLALVVLDGVNSGVQKSAGQIGDGGQS